MSDLIDTRPEDLKTSLRRNGVWDQNSCTYIFVAMFYDRPSCWLYKDIVTSREMVHRYTELVDMACEYADAMAYPWMKTRLKDIVWVDFKGFYETLAQLVRDNAKKMPLNAHDKQLMSMLAAIWVKVGIFSDDPQSQHPAVETSPPIVTPRRCYM